MGAVAMLFSDIEDSTALVSRLGERWIEVLAAHRRICRDAWQRHSGAEMATEGDSFFVTFADARAAVLAAVDVQERLRATRWPYGVAVRTRIGAHYGPAQPHENGYVGLAVHHAARMCSAAHGDQIVVSEELLDAAGALPDHVTSTDLGCHFLRGLGVAHRLHQLNTSGRTTDCFGPLRDIGPGPGGADRIAADRWVTIATIDNHEVVREGVAARLQREPDLDVVASVATVEEYLERPGEPARVVLLDLWLDAGDATDQIPRLTAAGASVLVCTSEQRPEHLRQAVAAGASGVMLKREPMATVISGVRSAAAGEFYCSSSLAHALLSGDDAPRLDAEQVAILEGLSRGLEPADLARSTGTPEDVVRRRLLDVRDALRPRAVTAPVR